jgi:hypothetical protein
VNVYVETSAAAKLLVNAGLPVLAPGVAETGDGGAP